MPSHMNPVIQHMSATSARRAVTFMREQYTHLDAQLMQDGNLHTDLFIDERFVHELVEKIDQHRQDRSLGPIQG